MSEKPKKRLASILRHPAVSNCANMTFRPFVLLISTSLLCSTIYACKGKQSVDPNDDNKSSNFDSDSNGPSETSDSDSAQSSSESSSSNPDPNFDPGRITIHRLNRTEYDNTIRDLIGKDLHLSDDFPAEDPSLGFDNIAETLTLPPLLLELYERAAGVIATTALSIPTVEPQLLHFEAESVQQSVGGECCNGFWNLYANGQVYTTVNLETAGSYRLSIRAAGQQAGPDPAHMAVELDGNLVFETDVTAVEGNPENYSVELNLEQGSQQLAILFTNDFYDPDQNLDRNLLIDFFDLEGPFGVTDGVNELRRGIVKCDPQQIGDMACLSEIIDDFVKRAWRRPVQSDERELLLGFYDIAKDQDQGFEAALHMIVQATLTSSHFLFRVELDDDPISEEPHNLNDWELASRLSYFIWSSMPDEALLQQAQAGKLHDADVLRAEVSRMLDDPKAQALVDNFAGQWLNIRALDDLFKDVNTFPNFDEELRLAMKKERELFFKSFIEENRPLQELLTSKTTFVNSRLADFYSLSPVSGNGFVKVNTSSSNLQGILTQAGLLSTLAHPSHTSPVRRGKWVLDQLLCLPPPPPPSDIDIPPLEPNPNETMREKLERHRADPTCASCHEVMDPIGLGLEKFDGIGGWREMELGQSIDDSGALPGNRTFQGAKQLSDLLVADPAFPRCTIEKTLIYALGRDLKHSDQSFMDEIESAWKTKELRFRDLIELVVSNEIFRMRRGQKEMN